MKHKPIKPNALKPGDTVAVVAPAAAIEREHLERGVNVLGSMGYRVKVSERALARSGILAGDDRGRASELQEYFADPEVKAIFSARGGYGCGRLLPLLDFKAIASTPKIFIGFSDATFLLNALVDLAGMISFHGPMVAMDFARGLSPRAASTCKDCSAASSTASSSRRARRCIRGARRAKLSAAACRCWSR